MSNKLESPVHLDYLGQVIKIGDVVTTGYNSSSNGFLVLGKIVKINPKTVKIELLKKPGVRTGYQDDLLRKPVQCMIVDSHAVTLWLLTGS